MSAPTEPEPVPLDTRTHRPRRRGGLGGIVVLALLGLLAIAAFVLAVPHRGAPDKDGAAAGLEPGRIQALQDRVDQLQQRIEALEQRPVAAAPVTAPAAPIAAAPGPDAAALSTRLDGQSAALTSLDSRIRADEAGLAASSERAGRLARLVALQAELQAGLPLGAMPAGAPAALARYAAVAPPTEAQLRLAFPQAAAAASGQPGVEAGGLPFWTALRLRLGALITLRSGDRVLLGSPDVGRIDLARKALDAGDLAACVGLIAQLKGPAEQAFTGWRVLAQGLLDARAALGALARQG